MMTNPSETEEGKASKNFATNLPSQVKKYNLHVSHSFINFHIKIN